MIGSLARVRPRRRLGLGAVALGLGSLLLFSLPACSNWLWRSLEAGVESTVKPEVTYDAVVLLGGAVSPAGSLPDEPS